MTLGAKVSELALGSLMVAGPTVPLLTDLVQSLASSAGLFLFAETCLVSSSIILEVWGLKVAKSPNVGKLNVFDFSNVVLDGLVQVNGLQM
jgi:hypothetical protein